MGNDSWIIDSPGKKLKLPTQNTGDRGRSRDRDSGRSRDRDSGRDTYCAGPQTREPLPGPGLGHPPVCGTPPLLGSELKSLLPRVVELAGREGLSVVLTRAPAYVPTVGYNPAGWIDQSPGGRQSRGGKGK